MENVTEMLRGVRSLGLETWMGLGMLQVQQSQALKEAVESYNHNLDSSPESYCET